jgi:hypothetical protein
MRKSILATVLLLITSTAFADDSTKTLPAQASATAQANAFGQQGERMKAAHEAAKAAATDAAKQAAADHKPATAGLNSHATSHANSHAANGLAHAAAGASNAHPHH